MTKSRTARSAFGARVVTAAAWGLLGCGSPAPQGEALAVPVLVFHGICAGECAADDVYSVSASELRQILADADALGFESISIDTYNRIMRGDVEGAPMHPILLTFDDGRHDAYVNADPILEAAHARATMFVIANAPASGFAFYMTWDELRAARASGRWDIELHAFAGHTDVPSGLAKDGSVATAPFYSARIYDAKTKDIEPFFAWVARVTGDLGRGIAVLRAELPGLEPTSFAVPFGDYGQISTNDPAIAPTMRAYLNLLFASWFTQPLAEPPFARAGGASHEAKRYEVRATTRPTDVAAWLRRP